MTRTSSASFLSSLIAFAALSLVACGEKAATPPAPSCAIEHGGCDLNATCADASGPITCACRTGFSGDGKSCTATGPVLVSGEAHTCGLWGDGALRCWGSNESGQIGDGTFDNSDVPVTIGQPEWKSVAAGARHTVGVKKDGSMWWWGWDYQLGLTPRRVQKRPLRVALDSDWASVFSSAWQICGLKQSGSIWCRPTWGGYPAPAKVRSALDGTLLDVDVNFRSLEAGPWRSIALGDHHLCAVKTDGTVWCWGVEKDASDFFSHVLPGPVQLNTDTDWRTVAAGGNSTCAIKSNGTLWCWGHSSSCFPCFNGGPKQVGSGTDWASLSVGDGNVCATRLDGSVWCEGSNDFGQLGNGTTKRAEELAQVTGDTSWIAASTASWHACATQTDQSVWCWGRKNGGPANIEEGGNTRTSPVKSNKVPTGQAAVATGDTHSCALGSDGKVTCWGVSGPYGSCDSTTGCPKMPRTISGEWSGIVAGAMFTCGVQKSGDGLCWGDNGDGQFGDGTTTPNADPVAISGGTKWRVLSSRDRYVCGISTSDELWCWGANDQGQLGTGQDEGANAPVKIASTLGWTDVSAGYSHTCGIQTDGSLWCWGENSNGELGDDTTAWKNAPVQVGSDTTWTRVSVGINHTCAIKQGGSLSCWGSNGSGELGIGSFETAKYTPQPVNSLGSWLAVSAGERVTCGVQVDGSLWCWGGSDTGLSGTPSSGVQLSPAQIGTDTSWSTVTLAAGHACGVRSGNVWCWGSNRVNEIGDAVEWGLVPAKIFGVTP